jgi:uncharacterized membrane protein
VPILAQTYPAYATALTQRSCGNCHISPTSQRNAYGLEIEQAMTSTGASDLTPAILHRVETMDAAGDGVTNLQRIQQGLPPAGAPGAKPAAKSAPATPKLVVAGHEINPSDWQWIPKNGMHPAIVHFPIALFISGLFLDLLGLVRKNKTFLYAGWYNLILAAISALAACATGYAAILLQQIPVGGLIKTHLSLAIAATIVMWVMVALRVHKHENIGIQARVVYYVLAALNFCIISYAGHLGGMYVYGG